MPYTTARDGTRLFYKDMGSGPVVLLPHSYALHSGMWEYQLYPLLEAGYRVIAPDRRGHGRSDWTVSGFDLDTLVDDVTAVLEHAGVDEHAVVTHSMGALESVHLAARRGRVRGMLFLGPFGPYMQGDFGGEPLAIQLAALRGDRPDWFSSQSDAYFARPLSGATPALADDAVTQILATPIEVATTMAREFWVTDVRAEAAALDMPVRIVHGDADASVPPETGRRYAELIPAATLTVVPGAGHGLYATHAETVNHTMLAFLTECHQPDGPPSPADAGPIPIHGKDTTMTDYTELAQRYLAAWNENDADARRHRVEELWAASGSYVDPMGEARGPEEISALIGAAQQQFPGFSFRLLGDVDGHHRQARFWWGLGPQDRADGDDPVVGFDIVTLDDGDHLVDVLGFLDRVPA